VADPKEAFETRLLRRVAQAVEAGEVPAHLITELQEEIIEDGGRTRERRLAAWAREELVLRDPQPAPQTLIRRWCREARVGLVELQQGSCRRGIAAIRGALAVQLVTQVGLSLADAARHLGVSTSGIAKAVAQAGQAPVH
jgi:hypothetical protein